MPIFLPAEPKIAACFWVASSRVDRPPVLVSYLLETPDWGSYAPTGSLNYSAILLDAPLGLVGRAPIPLTHR